MGVAVDVIAGRPLCRPVGHPIEGIASELVRTPYVRDAVYRWQRRRGFGRLTAAALHADEDIYCRAAWRRIAARGVQPDIVHAHAIHQAARLRRNDIPVVINLPGPPHARYVNDLRMADALVSDGWSAGHLPEMIGRPVDRVAKGVDSHLFSPEGSGHRDRMAGQDGPVVLTVSRLVPLKNVALLLHACAEARRRIPHLRVAIVGEGPDRDRLVELSARLGLSDAVVFAGYVPHAETPAWYRSADLFALSSDFDNSPNVVLEAMASGLPVVATDVGGVSDFVRPGEQGALVPRGDASAMASAIVDLLSAPGRARAIGAANRTTAVTQYSWRASARQLLDVYERVLSRPGSAIA